MRFLKSVLFFLCLDFALSQFALGGENVKRSLVKSGGDERIRQYTGDPSVDFFSIRPNSPGQKGLTASRASSDDESSTERKSPAFAALLSGVLPGSGEFYSKSYIKSGVFFAAEVIAWTVNFAYNKKGDRATADFQNFADANWSVVDYASWLNSFKGCSIDINPDVNLPPWRRVNWAQLNECERKLGGFFSHSLPPYGDQQYYELIGKYPQYNPGWRDADRDQDISETNISEMFKRYSRMRGEANDFYDVASTAVLIVVVNHILSAADAAWSATRYNSVHAEVGMKLQRTPFGVEAVPTATIQVHW